MKKANKLLAILLCLAMFISLLPTWALAEDAVPVEEPAVELMQEAVQEEPEAEHPEQVTEPVAPAEEAPAYEEPTVEEAVIEEPVEEVLPEPSEEVFPEESADEAEPIVAEEPVVLPDTEGADAETEAAPEDAVVTETAVEPDVQESVEPAEETDAVPVKLVFTVTPENAELIVYTKDEYDEKTEIDPEEDGSYLLLPGEYFYTLTAEEYVGVEEESFTVEPSEEPIEVELTLMPVQPEEAENIEEAALQAETEEEETATLMASSGTCGTNLTWNLDDEGTLTISGTGEMDNHSPPSAGPWYSYRSQIKKVTINEGVTSIGERAFYNCSELTSMTIPSSVTSIEDAAFQDCSSLTSVTIPSSVTIIGNSAFWGCSSLMSVTIPSSVTSIGVEAFCDCSSLQSITIPDGVTVIGDSAFSNCSSLTKVVIPNGTRCGFRPFSGCSGLKTAGPVGGGYDLEFYWTNEIPEDAMSGCNGLKLVVLPDSVTKINRYALSDCYNLQAITIPANVKEIGEKAFSWCNHLQNICFLGGTPDNISNDSFNGVTATAYYPDDGSWWEEDLLDYGGELTWVAVSQSRVRYNANGGTGAPAAQDKTYGVPLTLSTTVPTRESCTFLGWSRNQNATEDVYQPGDQFYGEGEVTLYAIWNRQIPIDAAHFPDENFRKYVKTFDQNNDGFLNNEEIRNVIQIRCEGKSIASLDGIEYFDQLLWLNINNNRITNLDLSGCRTLRSLNCNNNRISKLDVSGLTDLETLYCAKNQLTSLDVSGCVRLQRLAFDTNQISSVNLRSCTQLKTLYCYSNKLTALDVSNCTDLTELVCSNNQITTLDVTRQTELTRLTCSNNKISALTVTNCTGLTQLECHNNQISALNVSEMTELQFLNCSINRISSLDVAKNTKLISLECAHNQIREINVTNCPDLEVLAVFRNQLTKLDISKNTKLSALSCCINNISDLDLRSSADLVDIVRNGTRQENTNNSTVLYEAEQQSRFVQFDAKTKIQPTIFSDNGDPDAYYHDPIYWAVDNGITVGYGGEGLFSPYADCTREQIVTFLWNMKGKPEPKKIISFTDVEPGKWYEKPISWAAEEGITVGLNDGTGRFGVGQACTREMCVSFLHRAVGSPEPGTYTEFTDVSAERYYYKPISWAAENGITVGLNDGTGRFGVGQTCTRGMIVSFLYRFSKLG